MSVAESIAREDLSVSQEYLSIAQYLEQVVPTESEASSTPVDIERADELIITANSQSW